MFPLASQIVNVSASEFPTPAAAMVIPVPVCAFDPELSV